MTRLKRWCGWLRYEAWEWWRSPDTSWRCVVGIHKSECYDSRGYFMEPPDPWWHCVYCEEDVWTPTMRFWEWFGSTRLGERFFEWDYKRHFDDDGNPR